MSEPATNAPAGRRMLDAVADCIPSLGTEAFTENFLRLATEVGAKQVTAFAYEPTRVDCLLSRNFRSETKGGALAAAYVDGWFQDDPLFHQVMKLQDGDCVVERLENLVAGISSQYLAKFFAAPGFRTKTAVLIAQGAFRLALNFYFEKDSAGRAVGETAMSGYRLIGRMLATHFLHLSPPGFPLPLAVLSERERQVCIGMLEGKKAEIIAGEIGVGASSVVTYRQRAYQKLGISSRGQLFSICRSPKAMHVTE